MVKNGCAKAEEVAIARAATFSVYEMKVFILRFVFVFVSLSDVKIADEGAWRKKLTVTELLH